MKTFPITIATLAFTLGLSPAGELWIGAATIDITPDQPVALDGHRGLRISNKIESRLTATALALESRDGEKSIDHAIMVSLDLVGVRPGVLEKVREKLGSRLAGFDPQKLFLNATHTHNAPVTVEGRYALPESGILQPAAYSEFMTSKVVEAIAQSWQKRQPGKVAWGLGHAVVAQNRRAVYANGTATMYGATNTPDFRGIEGFQDHGLDLLFFWDRQDHLLATVIDVPCPSQEAEGGLSLHADFWHPVRERLRARHGPDLCVLGWAGAGGDQTSRPIYRKEAEARMRKLRGLTGMEEIARRVVAGWEDALAAAAQDARPDAVLRHSVQTIELPYRKVTEPELEEARVQAAKFVNDPAQRWNYRWHQAVIERYEAQKAGTEGKFAMELHALRLGDVAVATNTFELFSDYGVQIQARSPAIQTFIVQLTGSGGYLPSERAVRGGGYSAVIQSSRIGPDGGQVLVDRTVEAIQSLWSEAK